MPRSTAHLKDRVMLFLDRADAAELMALLDASDGMQRVHAVVQFEAETGPLMPLFSALENAFANNSNAREPEEETNG